VHTSPQRRSGWAYLITSSVDVTVEAFNEMLAVEPVRYYEWDQAEAYAPRRAWGGQLRSATHVGPQRPGRHRARDLAPYLVSARDL